MTPCWLCDASPAPVRVDGVRVREHRDAEQHDAYVCVTCARRSPRLTRRDDDDGAPPAAAQLSMMWGGA